MSEQPITAGEPAEHVQFATSLLLPGIVDPPVGSAFEYTAPAAGQRFRVTVTEVPGWSAEMDRELAEVTGSEATS